MQSQTDPEQPWRDHWAKDLALARQRPAMFITRTDTAHRFAVREPLRLVWIGQAFRRPVSATVLLAPTQYVVRCYTGPLVRPIQQMFPFDNAPVIGEGWNAPYEQLTNEYMDRIVNGLPRFRGWRKQFNRSTGPHLRSPMFPLVLARRFAIGYRVDKGMWCQSFEAGWPQSEPCLISDPSPVGLFAAAELDAQWFTGLPFGEKEVAGLAAMPHVTVEWHPTDDLLPDGPLSLDRVREWIKP